jgi:1-acyl-sn-glycerol-3-phosphate acyltransferase
MIPARKSRAFAFLALRWVERAIRRRFHGVFIAGGEHLAAASALAALVGCVNHTNWWDGFVLAALSRRRMPHDIYLAMEERNLRRYRFFTRLGVFGVDLAAPAANVAALRYALRLLRGASSTRQALIWMFVQGELTSERRPVQARPGAEFLARHSPAPLLPVALRYAWLNESRPSIFVRILPPLPAGVSSDEIAAALNRALAETDRSLDRSDLGGYEPIFAAGMSINRRWDWLRHVLTGRREVFDKFNR